VSVRNAKRLILLLSILGVTVALLCRDERISGILVTCCALLCMGVFYSKLPELSNVSEDSPKAKTIRHITVFNVVFIGGMLILGTLLEKGIIHISDATAVLLMPTIFGVLIFVFGNVAPKLPYNRYTGLRLPWTVRDEETWLVAHRLLGYLAFPCGILCFAGIVSPRASVIIPMAMLFVWIGIPALLSLLFFYKKWKP